MNNSKKTIKLSEITTTPIKLKYAATYFANSNTKITRTFGDDYDISVFKIEYDKTVNMLGSFQYETTTDTISPATSNIVYKEIKNLYYQNYLTGSQLFSSSYYDWNQQSTACSGSGEYEYRYFPIENDPALKGPNPIITIITINPNLYGEQISRSTFKLMPSTTQTYIIKDDGNGNLIDVQNSNTHVGNIIYSQGLVIITNQDYVSAFRDV